MIYVSMIYTNAALKWAAYDSGRFEPEEGVTIEVSFILASIGQLHLER